MKTPLTLRVKCRNCEQYVNLTVDQADYQKWITGTVKYIQNAMPYLTPGERELLISQTCEPCFDKLFKPGA